MLDSESEEDFFDAVDEETDRKSKSDVKSSTLSEMHSRKRKCTRLREDTSDSSCKSPPSDSSVEVVAKINHCVM